jgi:xanthine dehydrogenase accessory factor
VAGEDVDAVVETSRGPDLGRVLWRGSAAADTGEAAPVAGITDRVVRAPCAGRFAAERAIGALVEAGERLGSIAGAPVRSPIGGLLRGLIADGVSVGAGVKLGDVDPRGPAVDVSRVSDKGRAVAGGVLEALLSLYRRREAP